MKSAPAFERDLKVATAGLDERTLNALLARTARSALVDAVVKGEGSPSYIRSVNNIVGAPEDSVRAPGPIVYRFSWLESAARMALDYCIGRSPAASGRYRRSWFVLADNAKWDERSPLRLDAQVIVTNDQPYHRKIEVGAMQMAGRPHIVEGAEKFIRAEFKGSIAAVTRYIELAGGYRLRRSHGRRGRMAGDPLTYPALVLTLV